jgi:DNA segregation ATPase FtsK/SpoIIIE, S-DNA-T family
MELTMNPELLKLLGPAYTEEKPEIQSQILAILMKLTSLGFVASYKKMEKGPIVNTYFFEPNSSSSLSKIEGREEDLAMVLRVESIILGRDRGEITIAVPRTDRELIRFDLALMKLLQNQSLRQMTLPILMGQTTKGEELYVDLYTQPHLLIAGTTGSGKSIFTSQLICSLALIHSPNDLEFILTDTKRLDLVLFEGLPHISKVLTTIHELRVELDELIAVYQKRTEAMSGVTRNIQEWNKGGFGTPFKYKILVIDEFADVVDQDRDYLATLHPKMRPTSIIDLVKRLAQVCRAVGIHIVMATQRPSVKVVSGDIKTNFPFRIAFKLPTMQDSRVVLDENGAERLLGKGDYLYKTATSDIVKRAHSAYVSINDIATIIKQAEFLRSQYVIKST